MNIQSLFAYIPLYRKVAAMYNKHKLRERKISMGDENPDKTFYVIGQNDLNCGLWWIVNKVVMHLAYSEENQYIPVIDFLHFYTQYHNDNEKGVVNVWEKYFEQPQYYSLDDIMRSKNIVLSDQYPSPSDKYLMGNTDFYTDSRRRMYFKEVFNRNIRFNKQTLEVLESRRKSIIPNNCRVLGILCRGTDYLIKRPKNHPVQPQPEDVIEKAKETLVQYKCDFVFLATEDEDIMQLFKDEFGVKLLYVDQKRINRTRLQECSLVMDEMSRVNQDRYIMGLDYLTATYILSQCDCFIGGRTGGTKGVLLMNKGFEYEYIYNLGFYE